MDIKISNPVRDKSLNGANGLKLNFKTIKKISLFDFFIIAIIAIFAINIGTVIVSKKIVKQKVDAAAEIKRPANVSLIIIKDSSCADCANINPIIDAVKKTNLKITKEETFEASSPEGKKLIQESGIKKIPTFIAKGEISKNEDVKKILSQIGEISGDTFKFNYAVAPYIDVASNSVKGKVSLTFITDKSCKECYDANPFRQILANNAGIANPAIISFDKSERNGWNLIAKYKIEALPSFVLTGEISEYPALSGIWLQIGTREKDGAYVFRDIKKVNPNLAYRDLKTGKIVKPEAPKNQASGLPAK